MRTKTATALVHETLSERLYPPRSLEGRGKIGTRSPVVASGPLAHPGRTGGQSVVTRRSGMFGLGVLLSLPQRTAVGDAPLVEIVGRNGYGHDVAGQDADKVLAHL